MRLSPLKHPLAVLRTTLGLGQKELADKLGCSWRAIQSIELLDLKLSTKLAERLCDETCVNFNWLMGGDPAAPMIDESGMPYRKAAYFDAQGQKLLPGIHLGQHHASDVFNLILAKVCAAVVAAVASKNVRSHTWRLMNAMDSAVDDLKTYPGLVHQFNRILIDHAKDTKAGREAILEEAVKHIRQWKEPRGKRRFINGKRVEH